MKIPRLYEYHVRTGMNEECEITWALMRTNQITKTVVKLKTGTHYDALNAHDWMCGCGHWNGCNLSRCACCCRDPNGVNE